MYSTRTRRENKISITMTGNCNSVISLRELPFIRQSNVNKLSIIELGPPRPNLIIKQVSTRVGKTYSRGFCWSWHDRKTWLSECEVANALFCHLCMPVHPDANMDTAWQRQVSLICTISWKRWTNMKHQDVYGQLSSHVLVINTVTVNSILNSCLMLPSSGWTEKNELNNASSLSDY